ncbi:hypothetical protein GCM10025886_15510 [Tetragenococcus halophilus subsp. flandriensis]|uniref:hypothetical protein n=1 Tax=Tetragenococcus halophilus TaxID=51669 RepID=UPI0023E932C2|nr:hypothetical protein [Tetragenococcus halophilus]GMA08400.1 hypothetical protein GCM10025886_15510 [Tetragenococcus halophilus subsp. flandriensis]
MKVFSQQNHSLRNKLASVHLEQPVEQGILNTAIAQLDKGEKEQAVLKGVKKQFRQLALSKNLSQEGLFLYTELQKPNVNVDTALSSMTWFP